jgi:hypothetical protein
MGDIPDVSAAHSILALAVVWIWHTPALHHATRNQRAAFIRGLEYFPDSSVGQCSVDPRALLLTARCMALLGALLPFLRRSQDGLI